MSTFLPAVYSTTTPPVTFGGLASGLNTQSIIAQLVQIEGQPITLLQNQQATLQNDLSLYQNLSNDLASLKTAATQLSTSADFLVSQASSSDQSVLTASASSGAAVGNHSVIVNALAYASTLASASFSDTDTTTIQQGTLKITVGSNTTSITVDSTNDTLQGLKDAINSSGAGVTASIIAESSGPNPTYRLVVTGNNAGTANAVSIDESGLSGAGATLGFSTIQAAQDASLTVDGIAVARSTNAISDVIPDVTLSLQSPSTSQVQVSVTPDLATIKAQINAFVTAYNTVMSFISTQTAYNSGTKTAGPLIGDSTLAMLQRSLQSIISTPVSGSPSILPEIGITTQNDGSLSVNDAELTTALQTNLSGVTNLFASGAGLAGSIMGFVNQAVEFGDGVLTSRVNATQDSINQLQNQIDQKQAALDQYQERLTQQFAALETLMSQLQADEQYLNKLSSSGS